MLQNLSSSKDFLYCFTYYKNHEEFLFKYEVKGHGSETDDAGPKFSLTVGTSFQSNFLSKLPLVHKQ